jgi:hypothetical protein
LSSYAFERTGKQLDGEEAISPLKDCDTTDFLTKQQTLEVSSTTEAHAILLNKSFFRQKDGRSVCRYCHKSQREKESNKKTGKTYENLSKNMN